MEFKGFTNLVHISSTATYTDEDAYPNTPF